MINTITYSIAQLFNYLKRDRVFSYVNILGLAVGLTAVLCISLYVVREINYDRFHQNGDRTYRLSIAISGDGISEENCQFTPPVGPTVKAEVPEVEQYTRISVDNRFIASFNNTFIMLNAVCYADTSFFDIFTFPLIEGDPHTALAVPFSVVLTEESARKIFGNENPLGKTISLDMYNYTVTGVAKEPPINSHLQFDALTSFSTLYKLPNLALDWDGGNAYITYFRLNKNADLESAKTKIQKVIWDNLGKNYAEGGWHMSSNLHPLSDLYLFYERGSDVLRMALIIFSFLALIILTIACINFVNLTTVRSLKRTKEASMRRAFGASRLGLVRQFLGESLFISMVAFVLSILLFKIIQPYYEQIAGTLPDASLIFLAISVVFLLTVITGIIGGSYPAMRLSTLKLSYVDKSSTILVKGNKKTMQNILIITQFVCSVIMIVSTITITKQLSFMRNMDLGFNKDNILFLPFNGVKAAERASILKERILHLSEVSYISATSAIPGYGFTANGYRPEGIGHSIIINVIDTDEDFLNVYDIKLKEGRYFSANEHENLYYIVNEAFVKKFGWENNAIGKTIERDDPCEIIGIVRDFNFSKLHSKIEPLIITNYPWQGRFNLLSIKYNTSDIEAFIEKIEKIWKEINPDVIFEYYFSDKYYDNLYNQEKVFRKLFVVFSLLALIIAASGIFTLMAYTVVQRRKEIGIRKVMGASIGDILFMLLKQTGIQLLIANLIALPVAWFFAQELLKDYAYRISLGIDIFISALVISCLVALLAVGYQALRAAMRNPAREIGGS
ncbi:MAG: ABC transporter permease [Marinilabiliaceae bacterium]|nr:ABC transporter permease [Marinilabiliaceae bacterium]